jgi:mannose/fructose-specific phosphotransferase system component IIA
VVSGINLPGLLKFVSYRNKKTTLKELVKIIERGAIEGITIISEYLGEKK